MAVPAVTCQGLPVGTSPIRLRGAIFPAQTISEALGKMGTAASLVDIIVGKILSKLTNDKGYRII
jgi:hypothetical protein